MPHPKTIPALIEVEPAYLLTLDTGEEVTVPFGECLCLKTRNRQTVLFLPESDRTMVLPADLRRGLLEALGLTKEQGAA